MILWYNVRITDINDIFFEFYEHEIQINKIFIHLVFEYFFDEEFALRVGYIENGYIYSPNFFSNEGKGEGYEVYYKTIGYLSVIKPILNAKRFGENITNPKETNSSGIPFMLSKSRTNGKNFCSIIARKNLVFSSIIEKPKLDIKRNSIALLVPTNNIQEFFIQNSSIVSKLILTFIKSLTALELKKYNIALYIGYDSGDRLFDSDSKIRQQNIDYIKSLLPLNSLIILKKFPKTKWLTFIWNRLFFDSYLDGNQYFLQLNDDVEFKSYNWLDETVSLLGDKIGVVGLNDYKWPCRVFTQALVNRNHFKIFNGQLFSLVFRNWCSDEWITSIYDKRAFCSKNAKIKNYHPQTYNPCDRRNFLPSVEEDTKIINDYVSRTKIN